VPSFASSAVTRPQKLMRNRFLALSNPVSNIVLSIGQ
jgi:hypothetical protein